MQEIEVTMFQNREDIEGSKVIEDVQEYASNNGEVYDKQLYSNLKEVRMLIFRPKSYKQ